MIATLHFIIIRTQFGGNKRHSPRHRSLSVKNSADSPSWCCRMKDWKTSLQIITIDKGSRHHRPHDVIKSWDVHEWNQLGSTHKLISHQFVSITLTRQQRIFHHYSRVCEYGKWKDQICILRPVVLASAALAHYFHNVGLFRMTSARPPVRLPVAEHATQARHLIRHCQWRPLKQIRI